VFRVLRPGGELHIADFGKPHTLLMTLVSAPVRLGGHHHNRITDNLDGRLPALCKQAGFEEACESTRFSTLFGTLSLYRARKPTPPIGH